MRPHGPRRSCGGRAQRQPRASAVAEPYSGQAGAGATQERPGPAGRGGGGDPRVPPETRAAASLRPLCDAPPRPEAGSETQSGSSRRQQRPGPRRALGPPPLRPSPGAPVDARNYSKEAKSLTLRGRGGRGVPAGPSGRSCRNCTQTPTPPGARETPRPRPGVEGLEGPDYLSFGPGWRVSAPL